MADANERIKELEAENAKLKTELEKARELTRETIKSRKAMLYVMDDLNKTTVEVERAKKEWEATFDSISDPLFIHDKEMRIVRCNRAYAKAAGMEFKEFIERPYYEVYPKMDGPFKMCLKALELQEEQEEEFYNLNKVFKVSLYPIYDKNGNFLHSIHILEDITEEKRAEEALRDSKEKYRRLIENLKERYFFYSHGPDGVFTYLSPSVTNILGYHYEEFLTHYSEYLTDNPVNKDVATHTDLSIKGIPQPTYDIEIFHKDRSIRWLEVTEVPVFDIDGKVVAVEGIACDVTERKKVEKKIKEEMGVTSHLLMIAEAIASTVDIDKLMEQVTHCTCKILGCDISLSYLWDEESKAFQPSQVYGLSREMIPVFMTEPIDKKMEFVRRTEAISPVSGVIPWLTGISTLAAIPLIGKRGRLGLIVGIYSKPVEITERDKKIMMGISQQVSVALEQAKFYKESVDKTLELSHKIETIKVMNQIGRSILSTLKADEILETVTRILAKVISCDRTAVLLVDMERGGIIYKAGYGTAAVPNGTFVSFADTSARITVETGRMECVNNLSEMTPLLPLEKRFLDEGFLSHIRVPITIKGSVAGILVVGAKRVGGFTKENLSTLEYLSSQIGIALSNANLISDLEELFISVVKSLSSAIDAKSPWTAGHSERVTKYAMDIAKEMGLSEEELKDLELAGLLHDVGKIGTYESILDKPGKLDAEEQVIMRLHPVKGAEILAPIKQLKDIILGVKYHHEFYDGTGYPEGLKGEAIPLHARILTVADTVDAMRANRPYRDGRAMDVIIAELKRCSGTQFDPRVVEAFLKLTT